jgi:hypothetical protein
MFGGGNDNFFAVTVEAALTMAGNYVDLEAIQDAATSSGADIVPVE